MRLRREGGREAHSLRSFAPFCPGFDPALSPCGSWLGPSAFALRGTATG